MIISRLEFENVLSMIASSHLLKDKLKVLYPLANVDSVRNAFKTGLLSHEAIANIVKNVCPICYLINSKVYVKVDSVKSLLVHSDDDDDYVFLTKLDDLSTEIIEDRSYQMYVTNIEDFDFAPFNEVIEVVKYFDKICS